MSDQGVFLIIFGSTGDLMKRKLLPALLDLQKRKELGKNSVIVGVGRRTMGDASYRAFLSEGLSKKEKEVLDSLPLHYCECDFTAPGELTKLATFLKMLEPKDDKHRLFYLATGYVFFEGIVHELAKAGLTKKTGKKTAIVFEKPFGSNSTSSLALNKAIRTVFSEQAIFRVDHYVAKDTLQDMVKQRSTDTGFEKLLSNEYVERIHIIADEDLGVGKRLGYYHGAGALKDMVQNHLLQVLSLVIMPLPPSLTSKTLHDAKCKALASLEVGPGDGQLLGQYESYRAETETAGIPHTQTETFARITLYSTLPRWAGVPLVIRTGKRLPKKYGEIILDLKDGESIVIPLASETNEYASILHALMRADHSLFPSFEEVQLSWNLVEKLEKKKATYPFITYTDYSDPTSAHSS